MSGKALRHYDLPFGFSRDIADRIRKCLAIEIFTVVSVSGLYW